MKSLITKRNKVLLLELIRTDFKLRYQGSALGYLWSLLKPLFLFGILYVVFVRIIKFGAVQNYREYLLIGIVFWNFFMEITQQGLGSIVGRGDLIRKISIPRWIIVMSTSVGGVINLLINMLLIFFFIFIGHIGLHSTLLWLPFLIIELYVLAFGISLTLSSLFVKYRDISYIWEVITQAAFYASAIIYPLNIIENINIKKILLLNPIAQVIQDIRYALITKETQTIGSVYGNDLYRLVPIGLVLLILLIGVVIFKTNSKTFAEDL